MGIWYLVSGILLLKTLQQMKIANQEDTFAKFNYTPRNHWFKFELQVSFHKLK